MDLISWLAFPIVLVGLCAGCGLAIEVLVGTRVPGALLAGLGLAAIVVVGQFLTLVEETVWLTTPVVVVVAAAGLVLAPLTGRSLRMPGSLALALVAVFAVYSAPIVLSGDATLAGFIKLDDTATWLAFTDQVMDGGRDLGGLAPSTHEAALAVNVADGYPLGVFIPLGVGAELLGRDPAWLIQPYMAVLAVLLALSLWHLTASLVRSVPARAAIAALAAQPALLFGYYLWGGVKELAAVSLVATVAGLAGFAVANPDERRRLVAPAVACGAVVGVLSGGGALWLAPILAVALVALAARLPWRELAARAAAFAAGVGALALPVILPGGLLPPTSSPLTDDDARGNLIEPLDTLQAAGIWPVGDFRHAPHAEVVTYLLIALALALAALGVVWAWRQRATGALALLAGAFGGCLVLLVAGSPWVDGKALATVSPVVLFAALVGAVVAGGLTRRWIGIAAGLALAGGVLWSNALAYHEVSLAPAAQFAELEEIGEEIAGEGPTLMTEYSPYGARHFLRDGDAESISELRRREIPKQNGEVVSKGDTTDTDLVDPGALSVYRTLVLRRSPAQSRPPGQYRLIWRGEYYEAWQRTGHAAGIGPRLGLGSRFDPVAEPTCADVKDLARRADELVAAASASPVVVEMAEAQAPADWRLEGREEVVPDGAGTIAATARIREAGEYELWLGGSVRPAVAAFVDGEPAGEVRHELNNGGQYVAFGSVPLDAGLHRIEFRFGAADLHPGSGGAGLPVGPIALSRAEAADSRLVRYDASEADEFCGREWDWIEAR